MYLESDRKLHEMHKIKPLSIDGKKQYEKIYVVTPDYSSQSTSTFNCSCALKFETSGHLRKHQRICSNLIEAETMENDLLPNNGIKVEAPVNEVVMEHNEPNSQWECFKCHDPFNSVKQLTKHSKNCRIVVATRIRQKNPDENGKWKCVLCQQIFDSKKELREHKQDVHTKLNRLKRNYRINENSEFVCNLCSDVFPTRRSIYEHVRKHNGKALCNICGKLLSDRNNLNKHHQSVHLKQRKYSCSMCDKRYDSSYRLNIHINSHKGIRNYSCTLCTSKFISRAALTRHLKTIHTDEKKYVCEICFKGFKLANKLKTHMFVHTGIYEHPCDQCEKGFRQKSKLVHHIKESHAVAKESISIQAINVQKIFDKNPN